MWEEVHEPEITLDYGPVQFAYPFGSLVLSEEIGDFVHARIGMGLKTNGTGFNENNICHSYLAHIGFFKHHGNARRGKAPGEARGGMNYVPFRNIARSTLQRVADRRGVKLNAIVEEEAQRLAQVVLNLSEPIRNNPVAYCFREVIRNVFEHANTGYCSVCAQKWYKGNLEIAVVDKGRGILASLSERYEFNSNSDALRAAIRPGITRVCGKPDDEDIWNNSGYGLYALSELASRNGQFLLCSGASALLCLGTERHDIDYSFSGTAVKLSMSKPKGVNIRDILREIVKEGEKMAPAGVTRKASKSSKDI